MRYKIKNGKFGSYFYDSTYELDMTLEMVLNKLNDTNKKLDKLKIQYNKLNIENLLLNRKIKKYDFLGVPIQS